MLNEEEENEEEEEEEVEEQPLWVDEEDPTWPEEGEDGWGFRTSQFFDKMSLKTETIKSGDGNEDDDDDDDDDELVTNWESEADDWVIKEIVSNDWEANVFADPSPLLVYVFARYGRRCDLLSISLAFVGFMDLSSLRKMLTIPSMSGMGLHTLSVISFGIMSLFIFCIYNKTEFCL